jgi:hypothetical protein
MKKSVSVRIFSKSWQFKTHWQVCFNAFYKFDKILGKYNNLVEPHRRLRKQEKLLWHNSKVPVTDANLYTSPSKEHTTELICWLFNDLMILAKEESSFLSSNNKKKYQLKANTLLLKTEIKDMPDVTSEFFLTAVSQIFFRSQELL